MSWWHPDKFENKRPYLFKRTEIIKQVRSFFDSEGFTEVDTPALQICPVMDTHIHAFETDLKNVDLTLKRKMYLQTSPEFEMKKLLTAGMDRIYQLCHVYRNAEGTKRHSPEFTLLEWYRAGAGADYRAMMQDTQNLLRHIAQSQSITHFTQGKILCDPFTDWEKLTLCEAFDTYAGIKLEDHLEDIESFAAAIQAKGIRTAPDDRWDDLFFRVMGEKIEPHLGMQRPTILYDYPAAMASLSRRKPEDPRFAERFELYVCGIELCNAFSELTDGQEQRARFEAEMALKNKLYGETYPPDEEFFRALDYGLPESGGNALGIDRLVMLTTGSQDINQILWAPVA
ncbi:MAG: EF-P lysine aminoacylase GenX [Alphaproteobacteria bacterium]|nr:EF-P lysine aminoacylase GenX [Alphaproteobacteria bacterium]